MGSFKFWDTRFHYTDKDKGPTIIFLHGHLENRSMWRDIIAEIPKSYRKISLDLPGHGDSGNLGYIHTMEDMAEVVKALADHLKIKRFILAGHSMGGYVALAFAEKYPVYVKALVLMNSSSKSDSPDKVKSRNQAIKVAKRDHKAFIRHTIPMLFRPKHRRGMSKVVSEIKKEALKTSKQGAIAAIEGMKVRPDREVLLHFAPYDILFIAAKNDPVFPFEVLKDQLSAPQVQAVLTENGHMGHVEDPEIIIPALKKFIREQS